MSIKAKSLDELKDSQIMFDKDLPPFGYMIVSIFFVLIVGVIIWSLFAHKAYMIKAQGVVTSSDSNYVMPAYSGEIQESFMEEGELVADGDVLFTVKSTDYDLQEEQLVNNKESYEKQLSQYDKLIQSIKEDVNLFNSANGEDTLFYSTFEAYKAQVAQSDVDTTTYKAYGYSDEQIETELIKAQNKKSELYYSALQSAENAKKDIKNQIDSIEAQMSAIGSGKNEYEIKATSTGRLHLLSDYKKGMVVQAASPVAQVTPENADTIVEAYVSTSDMARLKENDEVQIEVNGLSQTVYGNIEGTVYKIDSNVTTMESENGNTQVFKVRVLPETDYLISKNGDKVNLANGMSVEARIIYDRLTYFDYALEKMGVKYR